MNKDRFRNIFQVLFGDSESIDFENRLFNISTFTGIFLALLMVVSNIIVGINNILNAFLITLSILYCIFYYYGRFKNRYKVFVPYYILSTQLLLLVAWIFNSGSLGGVSFIFLSFLLVTIGIVPVRQHHIWFIVVLLNYLLGLSIEIVHPEWIQGYANPQQRYGDIISTFFISFAFAYFFIRVLKINYAVEHRRTLKQKQLIEMQNAYLENSNLVKDRLFTVLAHDLRSPLSSLKAMISVFEDEIKENKEMNEIASAIDNRLTYNLQLLDDLMLWSKSRITENRLQRSKINFHDIVSDSYLVLKQNADAKNINLLNNVNADSVIFADANSIRAVVRNLLSNAIKFCNEGGTVIVDFSKTDTDFIIRISDNGIGMSDDLVSKLFTEKHFTMEGTQNERGSGLGLLLVKDFVEQNGGSVTVESKPGCGTSVQLFFSARD